MKQILIINKNARQMRKGRTDFVAYASDTYPDLRIEVVHPRQLRSRVAWAAQNYFERVIACGGDGSIATVANTLSKSKVEMGIIPGGTTNSFARSLKLPLDIKEALALAIEGKSEPINLGSVNGHTFISVAALGLSEKVASTIPDSLKKNLGRLSYAIWGTAKFVASRSFEAEIKYDSKTEKISTHQLIVANARFHGSLAVAQDASTKKNELIVLAFERSGSKISHLKNLVLYGFGRHDHANDVVLLRSNNFKLKTRKKLKIEVDGEVMTHTPAVFKLEKDALKIVTKH